MIGRRIKALRRLRDARVTQRNVAGGKLEAAEDQVRRAMAERDEAMTASLGLLTSAPDRLRAARDAVELVKFDHERQVALTAIDYAQARVDRAEEVATLARKVLAQCELELRRAERVLTKLVDMRNVVEEKAEKVRVDDIVNARFQRADAEELE
ncbi:MAG: hypothetical protein HY698_19240 [Deltaproteobacteria bacterium]|nr:hypothetical protein [Deltaproteobacteria bacterium]